MDPLIAALARATEGSPYARAVYLVGGIVRDAIHAARVRSEEMAQSG